MSAVGRGLAGLLPARAWPPIVALCVAAGCSFDDSTNKWLCKVPQDCLSHGTGYKCSAAGFCTKPTGMSSEGGAAPADSAVGDAARDAGTDAGRKEPCKDINEDPPLCFDGDLTLAMTGACKPGRKHCEDAPAGRFYGACLGQVNPVDERCNNIDDDCDGTVDESTAGASCVADNARGTCTAGTMTCSAGVARCEAVTEPTPEVCDGADNDCDGKTDEGTDKSCYPGDPADCKLDNAGTYVCIGVCAPGKQLCEQGKLKDCAGATVPAANNADPCTPLGSTAADDDCDGKIDEECMCTGAMTQDCYTGPAGTDGKGLCHHGTQTCSNGTFSACTGTIMPAPETCLNEGADDNCDGTADNVPMKGDTCTDMSKQGLCRTGTNKCVNGNLTCSTLPPVTEACNGRDDDCDGIIDNGFDLQTDAAHCGSCTNTCAVGQICCSGQCVDTRIDDNHCGMCAMAACGSGRSCCASTCVDLKTDENNCGMCDHPCASTQTCCGGQCVDTRIDKANCSSCGHPCATAEGCCMGTCTNLQIDNKNCGMCEKACSVLGVGLTCNCTGGRCMGTAGLCK